jgi:hypothetical protein
VQHIIVAIAPTGSSAATELDDAQHMFREEMAASLNLLVFGPCGGPQ